MCNEIHRDNRMESIMSFGIGYKLFLGDKENARWMLGGEGKPTIPIGEWLDFNMLKLDPDWRPGILNRETDYGFCFFTSFDEAKKVAVNWFKETSKAVWIAEISYEQGLAEYTETRMMTDFDVRAAICKRFKINRTQWGGLPY